MHSWALLVRPGYCKSMHRHALKSRILGWRCPCGQTHPEHTEERESGWRGVHYSINFFFRSFPVLFIAGKTVCVRLHICVHSALKLLSNNKKTLSSGSCSTSQKYFSHHIWISRKLNELFSCSSLCVHVCVFVFLSHFCHCHMLNWIYVVSGPYVTSCHCEGPDWLQLAWHWWWKQSRRRRSDSSVRMFASPAGLDSPLKKQRENKYEDQEK